MSTMCRSWLKAVRMTADYKTRIALEGSAVLGDRASGYTVELRDASQIYVGRQDCKYCAKAEAFSIVARRIDEGTPLCDYARKEVATAKR